MDEATAARTMQAIDDALAPALRNTDNLGTVQLSVLAHAINSIRQALAVVVYGPPPAPPVPEQAEASQDEDTAQDVTPAPEAQSDPVVDQPPQEPFA